MNCVNPHPPAGSTVCCASLISRSFHRPAPACGDDTQARLAAAGDQFVGLDRNRDAIVRIETATRQLDGNFTHRGFDCFGSLQSRPVPAQVQICEESFERNET